MSATSAQDNDDVMQRGVIGLPFSPDATTLPFPISPEGNPFFGPSASNADRQQTLRIARLGKALFWDEQLSSDNTMACGTCHFPESGGIDPRPGRIAPNGVRGSEGMHPQDTLQDYFSDPAFIDGAPPTKRVTGFNAPSMINAAFSETLFWLETAGPGLETVNGNGVLLPGFEEYAALEALALVPPVSNVEMAHDGLSWESGEIQNKLANSTALRYASPSSIPPDLADLVGKNYEQLFSSTFGANGGPAVTRLRFARAIAHYIRTLVSDQAPVDLPQGQGGLTPLMAQGFGIMRKNNCLNCHSASATPELAVDPDTGQRSGGFVNKFDAYLSRGGDDLISVNLPGTDHDIDVKVPSLRNVGLRPRFFHTGLIESQDELLDFYEGAFDGPDDFPIPATRFMTPLTAAQRNAVAAFLFEGLTDPRVAQALPPFDRPDLYSERLNALGPNANIIDKGTGSPGLLDPPSIIANNPLAFDRDEFKVGLEGGLPGAFGLLQLSLIPHSLPQQPGAQIANILTVLDGDGMGTVRLAQVPSGALIGTTWFGRWVTYEAVNGSVIFAISDEASFLVQ